MERNHKESSDSKDKLISKKGVIEGEHREINEVHERAVTSAFTLDICYLENL